MKRWNSSEVNDALERNEGAVNLAGWASHVLVSFAIMYLGGFLISAQAAFFVAVGYLLLCKRITALFVVGPLFVLFLKLCTEKDRCDIAGSRH